MNAVLTQITASLPGQSAGQVVKSPSAVCHTIAPVRASTAVTAAFVAKPRPR